MFSHKYGKADFASIHTNVIVYTYILMRVCARMYVCRIEGETESESGFDLASMYRRVIVYSYTHIYMRASVCLCVCV